MREGSFMLKLFDDLCGYYMPSFFYIYTKDYIDFGDFEKNPPEVKGTFIHEYCHYLQDVSTTFGFINAIYVLQELIKNTSEEDKDQEEILTTNRRNYSLCYGDRNVDDTIFHINSVKIESNDELDYVLVRYNGCREFQFGNHCISENMAYLVERRLYNTRERYDEFPYNVCEKICEYEYNEFSENKMWIMALCELALLEIAGGVFFVKALRLMKEKQFIPQNTLDIVKFIDENFNIGFRGRRDTIEKFLENLYPKTVIDFQPIKLWILTRYEIGCNFREKCKCFISAALSTEDPGYRFGFWQQIMNRFGGPNVVNGQGELLHGAYLNGSPVDLEYILAPMAISQLFDCTGSYRKKTCPLLEICCRSVEKTCYSEICSSDPRKRILKTPLCPIGVFWKIYNIENNGKISDQAIKEDCR